MWCMRKLQTRILSIFTREANARKGQRLPTARHIQINGRTIAEVAGILCKAYDTIKARCGRFTKRCPPALTTRRARAGRPGSRATRRAGF